MIQSEVFKVTNILLVRNQSARDANTIHPKNL